jgi:signal peptidase I
VLLQSDTQSDIQSDNDSENRNAVNNIDNNFDNNAATDQTAVVQPKPPLVPRIALWRDAAEVILLIVAIYTLVNLATARAVVEGSSMYPNFETGQLVIVNRFAYYFDAPQRGDVVVLHNPRNENEDFIKRVVGLPGEQVAIREGRVWVNNTLLEEPYIERFCSLCDGEWILARDEYFVLGDNRPNSHDSHAFGPIKKDLIVGMAWVRYWPLPEFQVIPHPRYGAISPYVPASTPDVQTTPPANPQLPGSGSAGSDTAVNPRSTGRESES